MDVFIGIVGVLQLLFIGLLSFLLWQLLQTQKESHQALPDRYTAAVAQQFEAGISPIVGQIEQLSQVLGDSLTQLNKSISALQEVNQTIAHSHRYFQAAVETLAEPMSFELWLQKLESTIQPLKRIDASVDEHYQTSQKLLQTTEQLLIQWSQQRDVVATSSKEIADSLARWAGGEVAKRKEFEDSIRQLLNTVGEQNQEMASQFIRLQKQVGLLADIIQNDRTAINQVIQALGQVPESQQIHT